MSETTPITTSENESLAQAKEKQQPKPQLQANAKPPKKSSKAGIILWLLLLVALVLAGSWVWHQLERQEQQLVTQQEAYQALEQQLNALRVEQRSSSQEGQKKLSSLAEEQQRLAARLQELEPKDAGFWRIEEAAELVTQAEQRLVLTADGEATLRLLKRADALLSKELHSSVLPLREQLLEGIAAMETFVGQDFTGHWLKLKNWEKHSQTLPLRNREKHVAIPEGEAAEHWWQRVASHLPVQIRKPQTELDVPLTERAELLAKMLLKSALQEARLGLLQQQNEIYQSGLASAKQTLTQYYRTDKTSVRDALVVLDELADVAVVVDPPQLAELVAEFRRAAAQGGVQ